MRVLLASSEVHPFSKTGGLADMVVALGKSLASLGHRVGIVTPLYRGIRKKFPAIKPAYFKLDLPLGFSGVVGELHLLEMAPNLTIYFVDQPQFYDRAALYGEGGADYPDNAARFIYLSKCVVQIARHIYWKPEIVHIHDWQVGPVPLLIRDQAWHGLWRNAPATVLTIHNLAYQGGFKRDDFHLLNLPWHYFHPGGVEFYGGFNCLKTAIVYSDMLTTVSPRYAHEITTEAYGCGLEGVLRTRQADLVGILNGVDYSEWNTKKNPYLTTTYSSEDLAGKKLLKAALQKEMGLPVRDDVPLFGTVGRLAEQKGIDIQVGALEEMLASDMQFVLLGSGQPEYETAIRELAERYPEKMAAKIGYDHALAHRVEAGCDFFIMPSKFEPCGLNQMYSLHYGTIPIVRVTGGLDDSVVDITENEEFADGIKFQEYSSRALAKAIRKALVLYQHPELLDHYRKNGMTQDFSWEHTSAEYLKVYERALAKFRPQPQPQTAIVGAAKASP
jgi:starch synthase